MLLNGSNRPSGLRLPPDGNGAAAVSLPCRIPAIGQVLRSDGLSVLRLQNRSGALVMRVRHQRWQLFTSPQALWALQHRRRSEPHQLITAIWLGFKPSALQRRWLMKHGAGARFVGL